MNDMPAARVFLVTFLLCIGVGLIAQSPWAALGTACVIYALGLVMAEDDE